MLQTVGGPEGLAQVPTESRRNRPPQPRGPDGRFAAIHGGYAARRQLRRPDRRRSVVKQAEVLRDRYALARGYTSWVACPGPVAALIEAAVEVRLFRRRLFAAFWARQEEPPKRYDNVVELERRLLATLGIEPATVGSDVGALLAAARQRAQTR
jgi:hypothetical protein